MIKLQFKMFTLCIRVLFICKQFSHFLSAIDGYVSFVSPQKTSQTRNQYFDVNIQTDSYERKNVRVMINSNTSRSLFLQKSKSKSPVTLINLSPTKTTTFFKYHSVYSDNHHQPTYWHV